MSYCSTTDVQGLVPQRAFGAETTPSTDQVLGFITNRGALLDAYLSGRGVSTPVNQAASPISYAWCKQAVAYGAAADAEAAAIPDARSDDGESNRLSYLTRMWMSLIDDLLTGKVGLTDAVISVGGKTSRVRGGFDPNSGRWTSRKDAYSPSYGATGRGGSW